MYGGKPLFLQPRSGWATWPSHSVAGGTHCRSHNLANKSLCRTKNWVVCSASVVVLFLLVIGLSTAMGHDGGFGHSRRTVAFFTDETGWTLEYRLRVSVDEVLVQLTHMDTDGDGAISAPEKAEYFEKQALRLKEGLAFHDPAGEKLTVSVVRFELGPSLTQTFVFRLETASSEFTFDDRNFPHKPGVVQIIAGPRVKAELRKPVDVYHAEFVPLRVSRSR
jgi:hypothetical protein